MTVEKVDAGTGKDKKLAASQPSGIRYSLPRPFLLVTPSATGDGSFKKEEDIARFDCRELIAMPG